MTTLDRISISNYGGESNMSLAESISRIYSDEFLIKNMLSNNCDNIYTEILIQIINNNNEDLQLQQITSEDLMNYLMNAFNLSQEKHNQLLNIARSRKGPTFHLNVGIIKIKDLMPKDQRGVLGYFINLYMQSNVANQYHTSTKYENSNPNWGEFFFFPLRGEPRREVLIVEVCKLLDPDQEGPKMKVLDKVLNKIRSPLSAKAFKVIGKSEVALTSVSGSAAIRVWYTFKKGLRNPQKRGSLLMQLSVGVEKDKRIVANEHEILLLRIFRYEQEMFQNLGLWSGKLSIEGEVIIKQHYIRSGLSENDDCFMKWIAYTTIHQEKHLSFHLLRNALHEVIKILPSLNDSECIEKFWSSLQKILPSCFEVIWSIRDDTFVQKPGIFRLIEVLGIFQQVESLKVPSDINLLVNLNLGWFYNKWEETDFMPTVGQVLNESIRKCTTEWLSIMEESLTNEIKDPVEEANQIIQKMDFDIHRAIKFHHTHFNEIVNIKYANILYECYTQVLIDYCKPTILEACKNLPALNVVDINSDNVLESLNYGDSTTILIHKKLYEIFLGVKRLVSTGSTLTTEPENELESLEFHDWFTPVVPFWIETAVQKALLAITKSIDIDDLKPIDENVRYSSSALDTLSFFYQIKVFWEQNNWPNIESMFLFFGRIVDGICRCCTYYSTNMSSKVSKYINSQHSLTDFEITREWCVATCNINEIKNKLPSYILNDMGAEDIIDKIRTDLHVLEAERCSKTIKNMVSNCQDNLENEIKILIERMVSEIVSMIKNFFLLNIDNLSRNTNTFEEVFKFLDRNLEILNSELIESTFNTMIDTLHQALLSMLHKIAKNSLELYRPPSFFANLLEVINIMAVCLGNEEKLFSEKTSYILASLQDFLELHASKTETLIHNYYQEIILNQKHNKIPASSSAAYGQLTIKASISSSNMLNVTILNGNNILPESSKKSANTYVKMHFIPPDRFAKVPTQKTSVKSKTIFPLYDEEFKVYLSTPHQQMDDNILVFVVKIQDLFRMSNKYLSECYLSFADIKKSNGEQMRLNLFRPECVDINSVIISELEYRKIYDKTAQNFINKLKEKNVCKS